MNGDAWEAQCHLMVADFNPWVLTPHCSLEVGITIVPFWTMKREWRWEGTRHFRTTQDLVAAAAHSRAAPSPPRPLWSLRMARRVADCVKGNERLLREATEAAGLFVAVVGPDPS